MECRSLKFFGPTSSKESGPEPNPFDTAVSAVLNHVAPPSCSKRPLARNPTSCNPTTTCWAKAHRAHLEWGRGRENGPMTVSSGWGLVSSHPVDVDVTTGHPDYLHGSHPVERDCWYMPQVGPSRNQKAPSVRSGNTCVFQTHPETTEFAQGLQGSTRAPRRGAVPCTLQPSHPVGTGWTSYPIPLIPL